MSKSVPVVRHVITEADLKLGQLQIKPVDFIRIIKLMEDQFSCNLVERHTIFLKKLVKNYWFGYPIRDLVHICKILNLCEEKVKDHEIYIQSICEILKLCGLGFLKEKSSDELNFAPIVSESISQIGYLLRIPSNAVRIQLCDSIMSLYNKETHELEIEGYYPTKKSYNMQMIEESGVVESLVMGLTLVEDQLEVKLRIIQTLQSLSTSSVMNCNLMLNAQAANRICRCLNAPDPSGQLLFRSTEILWNLLENASKKEVIDQLSNYECIMALKETFMNQAIHGYRHYDEQLRNDLLVIATLVAESPLAPFIETGFAKLLVMFAGIPEVKTFNPLLSNFILTTNHEDFEMKKLLFNMVVALTNDLGAVQLLTEGQVLLALFQYVKPNAKHKIREWSAAQFEELRLHAMASLTLIAPLMVDDYMECQGNTRLLLLLDCCAGQGPCIDEADLSHGTGDYGNKQVQMCYCLRLLRSVSSLGEETVNQSLSDQGAIQQLLGILNKLINSKELENKMCISMQSDILIILSAICENDIHRKELFGTDGVEILITLLNTDLVKLCSGLGHHRLILASVDCIWCCIIGCYTTEDVFLEKQGIFFLLDLLESCPRNMYNLILGVLLEFCDNPKTPLHINVWRGMKDLTAASLLLQLWIQEERGMKTKRDDLGRIVDAKKPLIGIVQDQQGTVLLPAKIPSAAVIDVAENLRAKIYSIFCKIGFEDLPCLCERDQVTLAIVHRYLDFKVGEVWIEIERELKQEKVHPISPDNDIIHIIIKHVENVSRDIAQQQTELLQKEYKQDVESEKQMYKEIKDNHKQRESAIKSWKDYVNRTSNYKFLKETKRVQDDALEATRIEVKDENSTFHQPEIIGLNTTGFFGYLAMVESTPLHLTGGFLKKMGQTNRNVSIKKKTIKNSATKVKQDRQFSINVE